MRMGFGLLIGVLIILFGLGIIINVIFHVNIPMFKILVGLFLIYIGLRIILGGSLPSMFHHNRPGDAVFSDRTYHGLPGDSNKYNAIFGKAIVDLRGIELKEKVKEGTQKLTGRKLLSSPVAWAHRAGGSPRI